MQSCILPWTDKTDNVKRMLLSATIAASAASQRVLLVWQYSKFFEHREFFLCCYMSCV